MPTSRSRSRIRSCPAGAKLVTFNIVDQANIDRLHSYWNAAIGKRR